MMNKEDWEVLELMTDDETFNQYGRFGSSAVEYMYWQENKTMTDKIDRSVKRLVEMGYAVEGRPCPYGFRLMNGRSLMCHITDAGREALEKHLQEEKKEADEMNKKIAGLGG